MQSKSTGSGPPTVSVTMAYFNRPDHLRRTLAAYLNVHGGAVPAEFAIVDDKSDPGLEAQPVADEFRDRLDIKVHYRADKDDVSEMRTINDSVRMASGEIVIVANPEALPCSPIIHQIRSISTRLKNTYLIVPCYSVSPERQRMISSLDCGSATFVRDILARMEFSPRGAMTDGDDAWYEHPVFRPRGYFFTAAMRRDEFLDMGGVDEDFRFGWAYADDDFRRRLEVKGVSFVSLGDAVVLHQYHYDSQTDRGTDRAALLERNRQLMLRKAEIGDWRAGR